MSVDRAWMKHGENVPESFFAKNFAKSEIQIDLLAHFLADDAWHDGPQCLLACSVGRMWAVTAQAEKSEGCHQAVRDPSSRINQARTAK
jgi:hypothetical protein